MTDRGTPWEWIEDVIARLPWELDAHGWEFINRIRHEEWAYSAVDVMVNWFPGPKEIVPEWPGPYDGEQARESAKLFYSEAQRLL